MKIISVASMRQLDARTIEHGTPGTILMERAGRGAYQEMMEFLRRRLHPRHCRRITVIAGKGNNGGDAYVVARCLAESGTIPVELYATCPVSELSGDARHHADQTAAILPVTVVESLPEQALSPGTVLVDGLLGTGIHGAPRPPYDRLIAQINGSGLPVVALDVPSGLDADTGLGAPSAVIADLTLTMAFPKGGLLSEAGRPHCGVLRCIDIGVSPEDAAEVPSLGEAITFEDIRPILCRRPYGGHKGTFGHCLVLGGSILYGGAPCLAAEAALRSGTGLVTLASPAGTPMIPGAGVMALIRSQLPSDDGYWSRSCLNELEQLLSGKQAIVFGPGIGAGGHPTEVLNAVLATRVPIVIDADGLRAFAAGRMRPRLEQQVVLTPHPGEMRVLIAGFGLGSALQNADRVSQARTLAATCGVTVVLKGLGTVVATPSGEIYTNTTGGPALATAGSGDVLAGFIGGLMAQGLSARDASLAGVFVHGLAGEAFAVSSRAFIADDLLDAVSHAFREVTPFA